MENKTKRQRYDILKSELELERASFKALWREICDYLLPTRGRFSTSDRNRGDRRNQKIIDCTGTLAARTLASGMMAGITSPARPWFRLTTQDPDLAEFGPVKEWLDSVRQIMTGILLRSNIYNILPTVYEDLAGFATAPFAVEEHMDRVLHGSSFPVGSYSIAKNADGTVDTFVREFSMTVRNLVMTYGRKNPKTGAADWSNFSDQVKNAWDRGNYQTWIDVTHVVCPNDEYDVKRLLAKHKKFSSCTYETGAQSSSTYDIPPDMMLKESGYDLFPILCPRWSVKGEDVYGTNCPGITALGDIKQLQQMQKRKHEGVEKMIRPPMKAPPSMRAQRSSIIPGDISYVSEVQGGTKFEPAHTVNLPIGELREDILEIKNLIESAFFVDAVLMFSRTDRRDITAREVEARDQEKLLVFGPVLEQLNQDALNPLIDLTFEYANRQGKFPPPPKDLQGQKLKVDYESIMAQAQRIVAIGGLERLASFMTANHPYPADPARDKIDSDQFIDEVANALGVPPKVVRSDDAVAELRRQKNQAAQAESASTVAANAAGAMKDLSQADMSGDNALTRLVQQSQAGQLVPN